MASLEVTAKSEPTVKRGIIKIASKQPFRSSVRIGKSSHWWSPGVLGLYPGAIMLGDKNPFLQDYLSASQCVLGRDLETKLHEAHPPAHSAVLLFPLSVCIHPASSPFSSSPEFISEHSFHSDSTAHRRPVLGAHPLLCLAALRGCIHSI